MSTPTPKHIMGESPAVKFLFKEICQIARTKQPVLIRGETGTGKDVVAREIQAQSSRANAAFEPVNCAGLNDTTADGELFGYTRGAFTGATHDKKGLFEVAHRGTLFLDELGDLPYSSQAKLLRALNDGSIRPVGGQEKQVDVRVIAATNLLLEEMIPEGRFRQELLNRFVAEITIPPLRERREDIGFLAEQFIAKHRGDEGCNAGARTLAREALEMLMAQDWPGNVRDLKAAVLRALARSHDEGCAELRAEHFEVRSSRRGPSASRASPAGSEKPSPAGNAARAVRELGEWILDEIEVGRRPRQSIPEIVDSLPHVDLRAVLADLFLKRNPRDQDAAAAAIFGYSDADAVRKVLGRAQRR